MIDLSKLDRTKTNAIVIRHAERDRMEHGQVFQPLNEVGKKNAELLGEALRGFANYAFFSSPVDRCIESVAHIQRGIFNEKETPQNNVSTILGEPGPFVLDRKNNVFKTTSCKQVIERQIAHETLEGLRATEEGVKLLVDFVLSEMQKTEKGTLLVFVTHDSIIAPTIFELTGEQFNHEHWPEFSDGFIIEENNGNYRVIRNNHYFDLRNF